MKYSVLFFTVLVSAEAFAATSVPVVPLQQKLTAVEYSSGGRQTGCGLRITGVTSQNLSLNVLITVFMKEAGVTFGVVKVVARKMDMKKGVPLPQDGSATYSSIGQIRKAWIKPDSGSQPLVYQNGKSSHNDAYMVSTEFASTVDLLVAISRENFRVGLNRSDEGPDEIFQFDRRISQEEAGKLSVCMNNLRAEIEEGKRNNTF
ncbi:MAG: hypothetical protein WA635_10695 [Gallionella sp.]